MICTYEEYLKQPKAISFEKIDDSCGNACRDWRRHGSARAI